MPDNFISAVRGYLRLGNFALDASSVYESYDSAAEYAATNPTAYPGQLVAVVNEIDRKVTIYQLGFKLNPESSGFELESLVADQIGTVKSINNILPDVNGNITINLEQLDLILTFLENTNDRVIFNKSISVPTNDISADDDVITKKYLEATFNSSLNGLNRTFRSVFDSEIFINGGLGTSVRTIPGGSSIKRVAVNITEAFKAADITISIAGIDIFKPEDVFETEIGSYLSDKFLTLPTSQARYNIIVTAIDQSGEEILTGRAEIYVDFNINFTD